MKSLSRWTVQELEAYTDRLAARDSARALGLAFLARTRRESENATTLLTVLAISCGSQLRRDVLHEVGPVARLMPTDLIVR